jgi:DNA polymerase-3 subunit epsilon
VLYVGKASSLHHRVNSYFRHQHGVPGRMLEMLSQVRAISFEVTPSALEAALVEPDEIKRHRPPYNIALTDEDRGLWFTPPDLSERSPRPSPRCRVGPFLSAEMLEQFAALADASRASLGGGRWAPDPAVFAEGYTQLSAAHGELSRGDLGMHAKLLLGTRLWRSVGETATRIETRPPPTARSSVDAEQLRLVGTARAALRRSAGVAPGG